MRCTSTWYTVGAQEMAESTISPSLAVGNHYQLDRKLAQTSHKTFRDRRGLRTDSTLYKMDNGLESHKKTLTHPAKPPNVVGVTKQTKR